MVQLSFEAELLPIFSLDVTDEDPTRESDRFVEQIDGLHLTSIIMQEVKS